MLIALVAVGLSSCAQENGAKMEFNKLTFEEQNVILHKGTERPYTGEYVNHKEDGTYTCKQCDAPLYLSGDKFDSNCGWPSFDDEIEGAVKRVPDADGRRTEIVCANCGGHLGHVFEGEGFTDKNTRHCVNSISLNFEPEKKASSDKTEKAIFAGGCFWGVEYYMEKHKGVISATSGYTGGHVKNPSYQDVLSKKSGHIEAVEIEYDPNITSYEEVAKLFFEIHDPTQVDRQGPDIGEQYRSEVFYLNEGQKQTAEKLVNILKDKGYKVATRISKADTFWKAENYHQDYYDNKGSLPYCHGYTKRF
ncbi:MAG: bifunctional methionine sulfoxide reductase B/A protein [Bacteroidales bacterium]|nr:bifunctional methionine sulfoxide reductase B/A protein [Bacteroidales bacterium]MCF8402456.1 bifunctional methionine sulfoxide reductase B/A protein [Bacteroidales bacterium]